MPELYLSILRDDGAVVYINGVEVLRTNMPRGLVMSSTRALKSLVSPDEDLWQDFVVNGATLVDGTNVIAVEVHQADPRSNDVSFDLALSTGPPLVITAYDHRNFDEFRQYLTFGIGTYSGAELGTLNDDTDSIRIPRGLKVTVCTGELESGWCQTFTSDVAVLPPWLEDRTSYFKVEPA